MGYGGVVLLMAIESACVPLPSEVTMPFSGYLVSTGRFDLNLVALAGAVGCLLGSYVAYFVGASGGRRLLLKYGRYVLIAPHEIELADRFFDRWGPHAVFISRLLPVVRTFIALARRGRADAPAALHDLHSAWLIHLVSGARVGRDEARTALGPSSARTFIASTARSRCCWS